MKFSELTPEEINALCAEVMGICIHKPHPDVKNAWFVCAMCQEYTPYIAAPNYLEDMNLCMGLVNAMKGARVYQLTWFLGTENPWYEFDLHMMNDDIYAGKSKDTPQEAIIKAVLLANGKIEEE